jgi:23S rRNA (guanine745-N1)-methyltransferase
MGRAMSAGADSAAWLGVDISRDAVRRAARVDGAGAYVVANTFRLPLVDAQFDVVTRIFAPASTDEIRRVLAPGGRFVVASPGPRHLMGVKRVIYADPRDNPPAELAFGGLDGFEVVDRTEVRYDLALHTRAALQDLLAMTPYHWNINLETRRLYDTLTSLETEIDVEVATLVPSPKT